MSLKPTVFPTAVLNLRADFKMLPYAQRFPLPWTPASLIRIGSDRGPVLPTLLRNHFLYSIKKQQQFFLHTVVVLLYAGLYPSEQGLQVIKELQWKSCTAHYQVLQWGWRL